MQKVENAVIINVHAITENLSVLRVPLESRLPRVAPHQLAEKAEQPL